MLPTPLRRVLDNIPSRSLSNAFPRESAKPIPRALQTVLLVDDDDALREVMEACLGMMGYVVIACCDAQTASQAYQSSYVDLLLTDLQMPGRSGMELARELTLQRPALPVLITSGSLMSEEMLREIQQRAWKFVAKPCNLTQLLATMQSLLSPIPRYAA